MFYNFGIEFLSTSYLFWFGTLQTVIDKLNESKFFRNLFVEYKFVVRRRSLSGCCRICSKTFSMLIAMLTQSRVFGNGWRSKRLAMKTAHLLG